MDTVGQGTLQRGKPATDSTAAGSCTSQTEGIIVANPITEHVCRYMEGSPKWVQFVRGVLLRNLNELRRAYDISDSFSNEEARWLILGEMLDAEVEREMPELEGAYRVILQGGFNEISWYDVAKHLIERV